MSSDDAWIAGKLRKNGHEVLVVSLDEFKGHDLVDMHVWSDERSEPGDFRPSGRRMAVRVRKARTLIKLLQKVVDEAERRGLLPPDDGGEP